MEGRRLKARLCEWGQCMCNWRNWALWMTLCSVGGLLSCASPAARDLQSITLTPLAADATGSGVQFAATGHWTTAPTLVTPLPARWGVCKNDAATDQVTVTQAGLATCQKGASGTYTVFAADTPTSGPVCNVITACGGGCQISGSAQLTCP